MAKISKAIFNDMVTWGNDMRDPNDSKDLTRDQRELFVQWLTDEKFYRGVLTHRDRKTIVSVLIENKYNTHNKWVLDQIRERFISYLKKDTN